MQAQGVKVGLVPYRESALQAEQYLAQHRAELIPETHAMVLGSPTLGHSTSESNASAIDWLERNLANYAQPDRSLALSPMNGATPPPRMGD